MKRSHIVELAAIVAIAGVFLGLLRPIQFGGDTLYMVVYGGSMQPTIKVGDLAIVKNTDPWNIAMGDIITFHMEGKFVTHRVIKVLPNGFITQGDANNAPDMETVYSSELIGKVIFVVPYVGHLIHYAGTFWGLVLLVWIPATTLIAMEVRNILESRREKEFDDLGDRGRG